MNMGASKDLGGAALSPEAVIAAEASELGDHLGRPFLVVVRDFETGREYHHGLFSDLVAALAYADTRINQFRQDQLSNLGVSAHPLIEP